MSATSERNRLQALFLDQGWVEQFVLAVQGGRSYAHREEFSTRVGWARDDKRRLLEKGEPPSEELTRRIEALEALDTGTAKITLKTSVSFEAHGADVVVSYRIGVDGYDVFDTSKGKLCVECAPNLGEDYQVVLRRILARRKKFKGAHPRDVLVIGERGYTGVGASFEQVTQIFGNAGIDIYKVAPGLFDEAGDAQ